ncbi:alpha-L-iduronidase-like [Oscarella lobularis]|uniref:alpha-L-iduronidase-like n=1 Tax=Oscarella lobularis TaxID=121494 RepID=UPI0033140B97
MSLFCSFALLFLTVLRSYALDSFQVTANASRTVSTLHHFWRSTGFCPPLPHESANGYDLAEDERQNLIYIGALPNRAISQVRVHWLLDLVTSSKVGTAYAYNFTHLDQFLDLLHENGLKPGFELMGNPSSRFTSFDDDSQVVEWKNLVEQLATRYIRRYGIDDVRTWNFETWNEPDHKDFDTLNITVEGFMNYYDACSEGLRAADSSLVLGGPGGSCRDSNFSKICWGLFDHLVNGVNYFTKTKGGRIDFISFHRKGGGQSMDILEASMATMDQICEKYPQLCTVPIYNDEADPLVGWDRSEDWRADARYAAVVVKIIAQHQSLLPSKYPYALLSNDNGFLNFGPADFFDQRTLNVRFQMNDTKPKSIEMIRKPVASVMGLLSLLGEFQLDGAVTGSDGSSVGNDSRVGLIASRHVPQSESWDSFQLGIIVYNSNDTVPINSSLDAQVRLVLDVRSLSDVDLASLVFVHYRLDNSHGNPLSVWTNGGSPFFPPDDLLDQMRMNQDPVRLEGPSVVNVSRDMTWETSVDMPYPSVSFYHFCSKPTASPPKVENVRLHQVYRNELLVIWDDVPSRCLLKFAVLYSVKSESGPYAKATEGKEESLSTLFSHRVPGISSGTTVYYKVSAMDYWGREGLQSDVASIRILF